MKKLISIFQAFLFCFFLAVLTMPTHAQQGSGAGKRLNAEMRAENMTLQLQQDLALSEEQVKQVAGINLKASEEIEQLRLSNLSRQERRAKIFAIQDKRKAEISLLLTEQQKVKFEKHQHARMRGRNQRMN